MILFQQDAFTRYVTECEWLVGEGKVRYAFFFFFRSFVFFFAVITREGIHDSCRHQKSVHRTFEVCTCKLFADVWVNLSQDLAAGSVQYSWRESLSEEKSLGRFEAAKVKKKKEKSFFGRR